jgi:tetratricopeptide (TPR) repeat protein
MREGRRSLADDDPLMTQARIKMAYAPLIVEADGQAELERAIEHARRMGPAGMEFLVEGLMRHSYLLVAVEPERSLNELKEANDLARRHLGLEHPLTLEIAVNLSPRARSPEILQQTYEAARANPKIPASHPMLLKAQATLGAQLVSAGRKEEGLELTAEAVEASKRHHGDQGKITEENMLVLATVQFALGRPREGLDTLRGALWMASLREPITSPNRGNIAMRVVASSLTYRQLEGLGPFIATNLDHEFVGEPKSTERNKTIRDFLKGWFTLESGSTRDAEDRLSAAVREMERLNMTAWASPSRIQWARAVLENGRPADALAILGESKSPLRVIAVTAAELARGQPDAVVRIGDDALKRGPEDYMFPAAADFHVVRGRALLALRQPGESLPHFTKAHSYWQDFDPASPWAAEASYWYGRGLTAAGDSRQGHALIAEALPALRKSQMPSHRALAAQSSR